MCNQFFCFPSFKATTRALNHAVLGIRSFEKYMMKTANGSQQMTQAFTCHTNCLWWSSRCEPIKYSVASVGKCSYVLAVAEFSNGDIIPEIVHHALPLPAMPSAVRQARAGLMMEIQLAVLLDLDNSNYFGIRKARISVFIIHMQQISRPSRSIQCHYYPKSNSLGPRLVSTSRNCNRDDTELFTVGAGTSWFGSRSISGRYPDPNSPNIAAVAARSCRINNAYICYSEVICWSRVAKKGTYTHCAHVAHWTMRTLHNNVGQWFGPEPPPPPPSEHKKSLCFPSSPTVRQN